MRELKTIIGAALVVLILTGYSRIASAQEADAVSIAPFPEIRIIYENSIEYQGNLDSLNDEVLILSLRDGGTKSFKWESIKKIKTYRGKKSNQALIGGGLGFLGGELSDFCWVVVRRPRPLVKRELTQLKERK